MFKSFGVFLVVFTVIFTPGAAFSASPWTEATTYGDKVTGKLDFGIKNLIGGWTELFTEPWDYHKEGKNVLWGVKRGLCHSIVFTAGGVLHTATFPVPVDVPLPDNGVSL
jgi:hypothetical protein